MTEVKKLGERQLLALGLLVRRLREALPKYPSGSAEKILHNEAADAILRPDWSNQTFGDKK